MKTKSLQFGKAMSAALFVLLFMAVGRTNALAQQGALNGVFTINSSGDKVRFSKGNLRYDGSTNRWRFAEEQWDVVGSSQNSSTQTILRDLFGWGTSGWNNGNQYYLPWNTDDSNGSLYGPNGDYNLTGVYANSDWGVYNAIINGGNAVELWYTLSFQEWQYIVESRSASYLNGISDARFTKAIVNGVKGIILFPDIYIHPAGITVPVNINSNGSGFTSNVFQGDDWDSMELAGCVFLPTAGKRHETTIGYVGVSGMYWSSTSANTHCAKYLHFNNSSLGFNYDSRSVGYSVRLVCDVYTVGVSPNPNSGGSVSGGGTYAPGQSCTVQASPNTGYTFVNWTQNGISVSNNASYTFYVTGNCTLVANFEGNNYTITAIANPTTGGSVTGSGSYSYGSSCTLTATANSGYTFNNWTKDGNVVSTNANYTFTVTSGGTYVANFSANTFQITATADPSAGGTITGAGAYNYGASCTLTATPATGYTFVNWTKNGSQVSTNTSYSFTVTEAATYVAHFAPNSYTITTSANPSSGGTVTGDGVYNHGASCTLTAVPAMGYTFTNWTKNGTVVSTNANYTFTVTSSGIYVANFSTNAYQITATADPSLGGTITGAGSYNYGSSCTLTATAAAGYHFVNWTKNGTQVSTDASYTFAVTESALYVAHFAINSYTITTSINPTSGGTATGGGTYNYGANCTLTATSATGYTFTNWTKNGTVVSTNADYTFTVTESATYIANFQIQTYTITASSNPSTGGTIAGTGTFNYGQSCTLIATTNQGYTFVKWTKNGTQVSTTASYTFTVTESASYVAHFQIQNYTISVSADPTSCGAVSGEGTYNYGQSCTVHATANTGYSFVNWTENGTQVSTNANYTFTVTDNRNLVAHFSPANYIITGTTDPAEGGTVSGSGGYNYGDQCTLLATANQGYTFINWTKNGSQVTTNPTYTFTVTESATYVAHFQIQGYTISVSADPTEGGTLTGGGSYNYGQSCTLIATANQGYTFVNWTKDGTQVSTNASYTFTVTEAAAYVAHFQTQSYTISVSANPMAGGTVSGGGTFTYGQSCTVHATTNMGYTFVKWTENGTQVSINADYTFSVTGSRTLVAHFQLQGYTITATANPTIGGTISGAGIYNYGQSCTLTAMATQGYTFVKWTKDGSQVSTTASYTFTVTESATYIAHFQMQSCTISVSAEPTTGGTVNGSGTYTYGQGCTVHAMANTGYHFVNWTENGTQVSTNADYTFTVTGDRSLVAHFSTSNYIITAKSDPVEGGTVSGSGGYNFGEQCALTAVANQGYTFINWTKDGTQVSTAPNYTFTVTESATYVAHFQAQSYTISVLAEPTIGGTVNGGGIYTYGQSCTVYATVNTGYTFVNWTENGVLVSTNANYTFIVNSNRTLVAKLVIVDGLEESNDMEISMYPNPVHDKLTVETAESMDFIEIYSITGALVYSQTNCSEKTEIHVDGFVTGTYLIRLAIGTSVVTRTFVKQ